MKKILFILLSACLFLNSHAQCNLCSLATGANPHIIDFDQASSLIFKFHQKFKTSNLGGTIYGNVNQFRVGDAVDPVATGRKVFDFHYCLSSNPKNSTVVDENSLYLVSTNAICTKANQPITSKKGFLTIQPNNYFTYTDFAGIIDLSIFKKALNGHTTNSTYTISASPNTIADNQLSDEVYKPKFNFSQTPTFTQELFCGRNEGYFLFDYTIAQILAQPECVGIRYYFGYDDGGSVKNKIRVVLCGVDRNGKNIQDSHDTSGALVKAIWRENSSVNYFLNGQKVISDGVEKPSENSTRTNHPKKPSRHLKKKIH